MPLVMLLLLRRHAGWPPAWLLASLGWFVLMLELLVVLRDFGA